MILVASCAAVPATYDRFPWLWPLLCVPIGAALGTLGIGLVGAVTSFLFLWIRRPERREFFYAFLGSILVLGIATITLKSGWGRVLGAAEAYWMAAATRFQGVGWGAWAFHQAEAQRAVLHALPFPIFKEIAPYFGVAPSLPFHLLAEIGWIGLTAWLLLLVGSGAAVFSVRSKSGRSATAFAFTFLWVSLGTTPIQYLLTVDRGEVQKCDDAIERFRTNASSDVSPLKVCPEIRTLEWEAAASGSPESFLRWHETFPQDVMPSYMLGRLAAIAENEGESLFWFEEASMGNPGRDEGAQAFKSEAMKIAGGDRNRLKLWISKVPGPRRARSK